VADEARARLVVVSSEHPHIDKSDDSPALSFARDVLNHRGTSPRQYRNMLVFAAPDQRSLEGLEESVADYLAWDGICGRVDELNLDAHQTTQAKTQRSRSDEAVGLRLAEAYKWALIPRQDDPLGEITFDVARVNSTGDIADRVSRKMVNDGTLAIEHPPVMLRLKLDTALASRWEDGDVSVGTLWEDYAKYVYLQRMRDQSVLVETVSTGPARTNWQDEGFAVAAGFDEASGRYVGLTTGAHAMAVSPTSLVVKPEFALGQIETEQPGGPSDGPPQGGPQGPGGGSGPGPEPGAPDEPKPVTTFRGSADVDAARPTRAFTQISAEVLEHLISQAGAEVTIRLEVTARQADGFPDQVIRTVTENARTLKFDDHSGFSEE
jgi:hypothetical protein